MKLLTLFLVAVGALSAQADAVRVQIIGPDKKPVAGAQIRVVEWSGRWHDPNTEAPREFSSDADGKVAFESKNPLVEPKREPPMRGLIGGNTLLARILAPGMEFVAQTLKAGDNEITLQAGKSWGGVALDEDQKPVVGAKVLINQFSGEGEPQAMYLPSELHLETTTDEAGKWNFDHIPRGGTAQISVADPRFVREPLWVSLRAPSAPPIFLERGAVIKGRLLAPDGQPAAGISLYPGGRGAYYFSDDDFRTAPDGSFLIASLPPGNYYLQNNHLGNSKSLPFIIEPKNVQLLKAGETRDIGDWKTESGILAKGKVVDIATKKPIAGANAGLGGPRARGEGVSDANGEFAFRASEDAMWSDISARGYGHVGKPVPPAVKGVIDLGTIELKRSFGISGTLKDKNGRGAGGLQLSVQGEQAAHSTRTSDDGGFAFSDLKAGNYTLKVEGQKMLGEAKFSVVEGQETAPIEAVVDMEVPVDVPKTVAGRALDSAGNPVAGAKILLRITDSNHSYTTVMVVSSVDGYYETQFSLPNGTPKVSAATRLGLIFSRADDFRIVDGVWRADLILQARGAALRGRVLNSAGQSAPRAWVSLAGRNNVPVVQSDENGAFSLPDVALDGVTLLASDGRSLGQFAVEKAGGNIEITLSSPATTDAIALADEILPDSKFGYPSEQVWAGTWDALGTTRIETAVMRARAGNNGWEWFWNAYLRQLARRDPQSFLARGDELARLRAKSDNPDDRAKASVWLETQSKASLGVDAGAVTSLLRQGTVAEALQEGDGAKTVDFAAQIAAQLSDKARFDHGRGWGEVAALIGAQVFDNLLQDWGDKAKLNALGSAVRVLSEAGDLAGARDLLNRMEVILPAAQAATGEVRLEDYLQKPKDIVTQARGEVAQLLAKTDPQAAFDMAKEVSEYRKTELLLHIGKNAAKLGKTELAAQALRQVFDAKFDNVEPRVSAAQIALGFDAKLADELFAKAWEKSNPRDDFEDFRYRLSIAPYAAARVKNWAGESRILIEREWAERIKAYKKPTENDYDNASESLKSLVVAMAKIDARRALEMLGQLPEKGELKARTRFELAVALLSKD
jgi:hypothetical protein